MNLRPLVSLLVVAASAGFASAQYNSVITSPWVTASFDLTWQEDPAFPHNDDGVLQPGERALMLMTFSFTGQNTVATISPPFASWSSGVVDAFQSATFSIESDSSDPSGLYNGGITSPPSSSPGPNTNLSGTSGYGVRWRLGGNVANGQPAVNGFVHMSPGQLTDTGNFQTTNPITNLARLGWAPNSYESRDVTFSVRSAGAAGEPTVYLELLFDNGTASWYAWVPAEQTSFGSVNIPIAPAPAGLGVLSVSIFAGASRRRRPRIAEGVKP